MAHGIPKGWQELELRDFLTFTPRPVPKPTAKYLSLGLRSHCKGTFIREVDSPEKVMMETLYEVKKDDLIINITFAWEGAVSLVNKSDEGALVSHRFPTYVFNRDVVVPEFFRYLIPSPRFRYNLGVVSPGGAGRNRVLDRKDFLHLKFAYFPPVVEQKKIARIISVWDSAIGIHEKLIGAKTCLKKGLLQELLTGKLRFKQFNNEKWKRYQFCRIAELSAEKYDSRKANKYRKCIELESLSQETGRILGAVNVDHPIGARNVFNKGDVLFGKLRPYLRKYAFPDFDGACSLEIWVLKSKKEICLPEYLFYLVQTNKFIRKANVTGGTKMPRADWKYVSEEFFDLPSIQNQECVVKLLRSIDKEIQILDVQLELIRASKKAIVQNLLSGKIRVRP